MKGVIFDFNGTLYWDSQLHYDAWLEYSKILRGTAFTREEMRDKMFGHTNEDIIHYAIGKKPTPEMVEKYIVQELSKTAVGRHIRHRRSDRAHVRLQVEQAYTHG